MEFFLPDGLCYRFLKNREWGIGSLWTCVDLGCKVKAVTKENYVIEKKIGYYFHTHHPTKLERVIMMMQDLQKTMETLFGEKRERERSKSSTDRKKHQKHK
ncbi:hypothetical protein GWI33_018856 [Rhynchophorus ferrugineus]|uniref:Uncharacterized protein n=1 Tax=Rhynchophorus ferrugineus TaxID=354439 RepID=A0A834HU30_RHYFE|nr:hypothetical protein GWI33_018856 [Rhynchophorus ferrugineus]